MRDFSTENTTVDSVTLYKSLGAASELGAEVAIIEVSSQALTQSRVYGIPFDVCVFTNFFNTHKSLANYILKIIGRIIGVLIVRL